MSSDINVNAQVSSSLIRNNKSGHAAALTASDQNETVSSNNIERTSSAIESHPVPANTESKPETLINQISEQVQKLQEIMDVNNWSVNFSVDEESGNTVIKVKDAETQNVIRQLPSDEWLAMAQRIQESLDSSDNRSIAGLLLDNKV